MRDMDMDMDTTDITDASDMTMHDNEEQIGQLRYLRGAPPVLCDMCGLPLPEHGAAIASPTDGGMRLCPSCHETRAAGAEPVELADEE
jgi:hypothetical protein